MSGEDYPPPSKLVAVQSRRCLCDCSIPPYYPGEARAWSRRRGRGETLWRRSGLGQRPPTRAVCTLARKMRARPRMLGTQRRTCRSSAADGAAAGGCRRRRRRREAVRRKRVTRTAGAAERMAPRRQGTAVAESSRGQGQRCRGRSRCRCGRLRRRGASGGGRGPWWTRTVRCTAALKQTT